MGMHTRLNLISARGLSPGPTGVVSMTSRTSKPCVTRPLRWSCFAKFLAVQAAVQARTIEKIWLEFFSDPSKWWDHRSEKVNPRYPDFKHRETRQALWLIDRWNPPWVETELAVMAPGMVQSSIFSWNRRLARCVNAGEYEKTMELFQQLLGEGLNPDKFTFIPALKACSSLGSLEKGKSIHSWIMTMGLQSDVFVGNCLVDMYVKCGSIEDAWKVFNRMPSRDVVSWNSMILGYVKYSQGQKALELFQQMHGERMKPSSFTFVAVLNACASTTNLKEGQHIHAQVIRRGCESNIFVASGLVDMYAKCESMENAERVFNKMPTHDVVAWTTMILGHVKAEQPQKALELYEQMCDEAVDPNPVSYVGVLNACARLASLEDGIRVHEQIIKRGYETDSCVAASLVNMYAKCGSIDDACKVFNKMPLDNVVSWNVLLLGYAMHGYAKEALQHFEQMCLESVQMDAITFLSLLSACNHTGLVDEGMHYFESMSTVYSVSKTMEHNACVVDLLGRAGRLHEAAAVIYNMSCEPNAILWRSLLGACRVHGNIEMGENVAKQVLKSDPDKVEGYVLLSNIYAAAGMWASSADVKQETRTTCEVRATAPNLRRTV